MKNHRTRKLSQRVRYALLAGMAGTFLIPQAAFAGPTGEHGVASNINIQRPDAVTTTITSTALNNVINWQDYSVKQGELVQYDGGAKTNNYLNIVTGANTSNINGKIEGGNNVYIVNPNGVIFGKSAEVNVGNLYVSTQDTGTLNRAAFEASGTSPLDTTAALKADVVNMGKINATSVEVHGSHIRFLNAADVTATNPVVLHTETAANGGYAHIGYESGHSPAAADYQINGANAVAADNYYQLVATKADLDNINTTNLAGNYMLASDIDFANAAHTPIGGNAYGAFTGKFDGNFFQIQNINVSGVDNAGFFGVLSGARIHNLGVVGGTVASNTGTGRYAGGIVGDSTYSMLQNVYVKGTRINGRQMMHAGLAGHTASTTIDGSYSKALVGSNGAGVVGIVDANTTITNTYNEAVFSAAPGNFALFFGGVNGVGTTRVENSYTKSATIATNDNVIRSKFKNVFAVNSATGKMNRLSSPQMPNMNAYAAGSYTGWDINNTGEPGAKWRIYEGRTLPMLTAFMNGRVDSTGSVGVEYKYRKFNQDGTPVADFAATSNNRADIPTGKLTYDSKIIKIVDDNGSIGDKSNVAYDKHLDTTSNIYTYVDAGTPLDRDSNIRNAGTKAMLWSDQDGPNLRGVNVTVDKRKVSVNDGSLTATRMYDGTRDVTEEFKKALEGGGLSANGFTKEDLEDPDTTRKIVITPSPNFTATLDNKNVGTDKEVTFTGNVAFGGTNQSNYELGDFNFAANPGIRGKANITKAPLILNVVKDRANKAYDGTAAVTEAGMDAATNAAIKETLTLKVNGNDVVANIKTDGGTHVKDDVSVENIPDPRYVDSSGNDQIHAGDNHIIRYTNVKLKGNDAGNYELYYQLQNGTPTKVEGEKIDLKGNIERRRVKTDDFKVYEQGTHTLRPAEKVYDGNSEYTPTNVYLSADADGNTGIADRDKGHITFALDGGKGYFIDNDTSKTRTKNVKEATRVSYTVKGQADNHTDAHGRHLLSDYYVLDADGVTKNSLENAFAATGAGKITPKVLTATVKNNHITKVYDAMQQQTDGNRNIMDGGDLVNITGFVGSETRANTSTALYASRNVAWDAVANAPTSQAVTYTASFHAGTGAESENYTLDPAGAAVVDSQAMTGSYAGTITPRTVTVKFDKATKIYDGTATNTHIIASDLDDGLGKAVLNADGLGVGNLNTAGVTSRFGDNKTAATFVENVNADRRSVEYTGLSNSLGRNYTMDNRQYGDGEITRRRIDPSGFKVRNSNGTIADATKVYDGTDTYTLAPGAYLTGSAASGDTGIVTRDFGKIVFDLQTGSPGHFSSDAAGLNRTSHVSEAQYIAYDVTARSLDPTNNPLMNYTFGPSATPRHLETVNNANPAHVTAAGTITPASIRATAQRIEKVYDGMREHTNGNRTEAKGDPVVSFTGWVNGQTRDNTSTALYADKNVARDGSGNVIKKNVSYTAQLTGAYADDYQIVNAGNHVISTVTGAGANKTLTANLGTVADAGTITPRKLNIAMREATKTYDGNARNSSAVITGITGALGDAAVNNLILGADGVTAGSLQTEYQNQLTVNTATSTYGRGTTSFTANANASNGTPHDVQYTNMKSAFDAAFNAVKDNYAVDGTVYGKGTINRKAIDPNNFDIVDAHGNASHATKVYDGTSNYTVPSGWNLRPSTGHGTGVVAADADKITFAIDPNRGAHFTKADNTTRTANVDEAQRVVYNVKVTADSGYEYLLKNYTLNGQNLESGNATATGAGRITRRTINIGLAEASGIDKVYDGNANLVDTANRHHQTFADVDGRANVGYATGTTNANKLVRTKNGYSVDDSAQVTVQGSYADKNVARSGGNVTTKSITYNVKIAGDAGKNYYLTDGSTTVNAEDGMNLSATGTITPRDLSGAFKKVTKVYDGTKDVPVAQVGFEVGANGVVSGDAVGLASGHTQEFESANVRGSGTSWTAPDGTRQHNWVNYANLSLTGADAGNYTLSLGATAKGLGEITPYVLNSSTVNFNIGPASKTYDGTKTVKWTDGSSQPNDQKKYISSATVNINGNPVNVLDDLKVNSAEYDTKDVDNGRSANRVTYNLSYTGTSGNFSLGGASTFAKQGDGIITKKDVTVTVKSLLTKVYDATQNVLGVAKNSANATVNDANDIISMEGLVSGDGATNESTATFDRKNAGTGKTVFYDVKLDTASAGNYDLKYNGNTITASIPIANNTITKRKVEVKFADVSKTYDATSTNTSITPFVSDADAAVLNMDAHMGLALQDPANDNKYKLQNLGGLDSKYGRTDNGTFTPDPNAGDKTVQYAGLRAAMGNTLGAEAANYEFDADGYGTGRIDRRAITPGAFNIGPVSKPYDGTSRYTGPTPQPLQLNASELAGTDANHIHFDIDRRQGKGARFTQADGRTPTVKVTEAARVAYDVVATADAGYEHLLKNYTLNGQDLENGGSATGAGSITRRVLELDLVQNTGIDKEYDGIATLKGGTKNWNALTETDANGNVQYATGSNKLVNDGISFTITSNYTEGGVANKNVKRVGGNIADKDIQYKITLKGDASNYAFKQGGVETNAEQGLTLSATGKITPKDLSHSLKKIIKVYDGTTTVNPAAVGFDLKDDMENDDVSLAPTHTESFQSPEIDGDGTTAVINGTPQKNWINYTNLTLNGADAGNYTLASAAKGLGEIRSPRPAYYTPDAEYYKELTQTSRMIPNEYAYENASMDQSGHFGRDAEAEVAYRTPSVNMILDGMDLSKSDILVTDRAVFAIVSEVFG